MSLLDLVPPALTLVLHHRRLFDEDARVRPCGGEQVEDAQLRSGNRGEELPSGKHGRFACACAHVGLQLYRRLAAFELSRCDAAARQPCVDGGQQLLRNRSLGERKQERLVEMRAAALRLGVELADGLDLVAEEVDADGTIHLRRVDVDDSAANRHLPGHLDHVYARVADREQVLDQHVGHVLLADSQPQGRALSSSRGQRASCRPIRPARSPALPFLWQSSIALRRATPESPGAAKDSQTEERRARADEARSPAGGLP